MAVIAPRRLRRIIVLPDVTTTVAIADLLRRRPDTANSNQQGLPLF